MTYLLVLNSLQVEESPVGFLSEEQFPHGLEAVRRAERMFARRVYVAKVLLEPMLVANTCGADRGVNEVDDLHGRLDGMAGG